MSRLMIALFVAAGLAFAVPGAAQTYSPKTTSTPMSKDNDALAQKNADAQHKIEAWRHYNEARPQSALARSTPR